MPVALPGVGPALPTAAPKAGAHAAAVTQDAAGLAAPGADNAGGDALAELLPQLDFKTLLKQGLGSLSADAPAKAVERKPLPAHAAASGDALAAAMAALMPQMPTALPLTLVAHAAGHAAAAADRIDGNPLAASPNATLAAAPAVPLPARASSRLATSAAPEPTASPLPAATEAAKIAAAGQVLPEALPGVRPDHPQPGTSNADATALLPAAGLLPNHGLAGAQAADVTPLSGNPPVQSPAFADALGEKMVWMSKNDLQAAHLQLNPPELGPLSIHLTITDNQVSAFFVSAHEPVREAIAAALPRLQEMMSSNGMTLGQANVGSDSSANAQGGQGQGQGQSGRPPAWPGLAGGEPVDAAPATWRPLPVSRGGVDTFV